MTKKKKGQFFLIFSVILGILILAAAGVVNYAKSDKNVDNFDVKCQNYKNEVYEISKYAAQHDLDDAQEFELLKDFSINFITYMKGDTNMGLDLVYGSQTSSQEFKMTSDGQSSIQPRQSSPVEITLDTFTRNYVLTADNSFHFLMIAKKSGEVYICE